MLHVRIVSPQESTGRVIEILESTESVCNIVVLPQAARRPRGDAILCDLPFRATGLTSDDFATQEHALVDLIARPDDDSGGRQRRHHRRVRRWVVVRDSLGQLVVNLGGSCWRGR